MQAGRLSVTAGALLAVLFAVALAAAAELVSAPAVENTAPQAVSPAKVVCFGASTTYGSASSDRATRSYPALLQGLLDDSRGPGRFKVINEGIPGESTREGLARLDKLLADEKPAWVLIQYGTNDMWDARKMPVSETKANLTEMVKRMKAAGATAILATLPPVWDSDAKIAGRNAVIKEVSAEQGAYLADLNAAFEHALAEAGGRADRKAWEKYYTWEGTFLHPNDFGYAFLANEWMKALSGAMADESRKAK